MDPTIGADSLYKDMAECQTCNNLNHICPIPLQPTGSEEREVFGVGSIPVAILPSR